VGLFTLAIIFLDLFIFNHITPCLNHILLRNNPRINVDRLLSIYRLKYLISDGSNFPWNAAHWKVSCEEKGILIYNTREKGAFKINLETEE